MAEKKRQQLQLYSCTYVMDTTMKRNQFIVEKMLYPGLYILAGAPKVGKSWLALDLCLSVADGHKFLKHETTKGQVVYLALEDSLLRLQNRIYELTDEPVDNLDFAILANSIGDGLEQQLENVKEQKPELKLIVIDTLQMIRKSTDISYGSDYKELSVLKELAQRLCIAIVLVHHTRKCSDADPFNMISGTTGLSGCVDGSMVLIEDKRGSRCGVLHCVGRDIENLDLHIEFDKHKWIATDNIEPHKRDVFPLAIHDLMLDEKSFQGSATELCKLLYRKYGGQYYPNRMTRDLVQHRDELLELGVELTIRRSHGRRIIELQYSAEGDSGAGNLLWVEVVDSTGTQSSAKPLELVFEPGDGNSEGDGKTAQGDSKTVQSDGRKSYMTDVDIDEIIHMSARKLGNMMMKIQKNKMPQNAPRKV